MSRADYSHWNEEAPRIWWEEEGRHEGLPSVEEEALLDTVDIEAEQAFAEDCAEEDTETLLKWLHDEDYQRRWPKTRRLIEWELRERGEDV